MGIPAAIQFKRYHLEHHKYQGEDHVDVDIPTELEGRLFQSRPGKLLWMFLQPAFYALRYARMVHTGSSPPASPTWWAVVLVVDKSA